MVAARIIPAASIIDMVDDLRIDVRTRPATRPTERWYVDSVGRRRAEKRIVTQDTWPHYHTAKVSGDGFEFTTVWTDEYEFVDVAALARSHNMQLAVDHFRPKPACKALALRPCMAITVKGFWS